MKVVDWEVVTANRKTLSECKGAAWSSDSRWRCWKGRQRYYPS